MKGWAVILEILILGMIISSGCTQQNKTASQVTSTEVMTPNPPLEIIATTLPTQMSQQTVTQKPTLERTPEYHGASSNPYEACGDAALNLMKCRQGIVTDLEYCGYWERRYNATCSTRITTVVTTSEIPNTPKPCTRYSLTCPAGTSCYETVSAFGSAYFCKRNMPEELPTTKTPYTLYSVKPPGCEKMDTQLISSLISKNQDPYLQSLAIMHSNWMSSTGVFQPQESYGYDNVVFKAPDAFCTNEEAAEAIISTWGSGTGYSNRDKDLIPPGGSGIYHPELDTSGISGSKIGVGVVYIEGIGIWATKIVD
jgi:hypothetical protein